RGLRETRQKRHLAERQPAQVGDPEVRRRGGAQAVGLVPVVDLIEVHLEDLLLVEGPRRLEREDRLLDLPRERGVVAQEARLDELLRDRGSALTDAAARGVRLERAGDATDVYSGVRPE